MKYVLVSASVLLAALVLPALAQSTTQPTENAQLNAAIQAVRHADNGPAATAAYTDGLGAFKDSPEYQQAYVTRMVELGLPEMAYHQARVLTIESSSDPLAWAVVGYVDAKRGNMVEAISAAAFATAKLPDNPFVQNLDGQLLAWYDSRPRPGTPDVLVRAIDHIRTATVGRPTFVEAYAKVTDSLSATAAPADARAAGQTVALGPQRADIISFHEPNPPVFAGQYGQVNGMNFLYDGGSWDTASVVSRQPYRYPNWSSGSYSIGSYRMGGWNNNSGAVYYTGAWSRSPFAGVYYTGGWATSN